MPLDQAPFVLEDLPPIFIEEEVVLRMVPLSLSTIQKLQRDEKFPRPRQISAHRKAYLLREIKAWGDECPVSDLPPPPNTGAKKGKANAGVAVTLPEKAG